MPASDIEQEKVPKGQAPVNRRPIAAAAGLFQDNVAVSTLLESLAEGVVVIDDAGAIVLVNNAAEQMFGYQRKELIGKHQSILVPDRYRNAHEKHQAQFLAEPGMRRTAQLRDLSGRRRNGSEFPVAISLSRIETGHGVVVMALISDITGRNRTVEELRQSEERYRRLYNDTPVMLHSIDRDGRLLSVSNYWLETLGYERSEVLGRISTDYFTAASRSYATEVILPEFLRTGSCKDVPFQLAKKNGEILDVLLSAIAEWDSENKVVSSLAVMIDVTERKRAEEKIELLSTDLAERAAELEAANRELVAFNYTVAHDLRKPLTVVNGYCQVVMELCGTSLSGQCNGYLQRAYDGTRRMNQLIDALLNFSRLSHVEPDRRTIDLSAMAQEVAGELQLSEPERRVTFRIATGVNADGDADLVRVVLSNLLGNAWKYTGNRAEGIIEFGTSVIRGKPVYFVRDNGTGFDMADADQIFTPFRRLHGVEEGTGFGIGLATVERIIRRHRGRVWAEGETGTGATFYFTLTAEESTR